MTFPTKAFALSLAIGAASGLALAQGVGVDETADDQDIRVPSDAEIQSSERIDTGMEIPEIGEGTQDIEIDAATGADAAEAGAPVAEAARGGEGNAATETVEEIVEGAEPDPGTGQVEAATGGAEPTENWFGCDPGVENAEDASHCDNAEAEGRSMETAQDPGDTDEPGTDAGETSEAVSSVREPGEDRAVE